MPRFQPDPDTVLMLNRITVRLRDRFLLPETTWTIKKKQNWAVLGPNGAGKSALVRAVAGHIPVVQGSVYRAGSKTQTSTIGYLSFESHQHLLAREDFLNDGRFFSGKPDIRTTALDILRAEKEGVHPETEAAVRLLRIEALMDRDITTLSTGEMRKLLIARELISLPELIVLDEPFDGLDAASRKTLADAIQKMMGNGVQVILITHRFREIPAGISHIICVKNGRVLFQGTKAEVLTPDHMDQLYARPSGHLSNAPTKPAGRRTTPRQKRQLIDMQDVRVAYKGKWIINGLYWTVNSCENWAVLGPNGAGKTTLLNLITGENTQGYANRITLFGKPKGSGESVWDIKQRIGLISADLQLNYRRSITARDVVRSGFFDSVGLFRYCTQLQNQTADRWIRFLNIENLSGAIFDRLSSGERRMVLVARAMVKTPDLLILDEPCQGLDVSNRKRVLNLIETVGRQTETGIILVTHYEEEIVSSITHTLRLAPPDRFGKTPYSAETGGSKTTAVPTDRSFGERL